MRAPRRLDSLADVEDDLRALWAGPADVVPGRAVGGASAVHGFAVYPSTSRPRLVVSSTSRAVRAAAVRRFSHSTGPAGRVGRLALSAAVRSGATDIVARDRVEVVTRGESFLDELSAVFGGEVSVAMAVGARRANRKPVLQVMAADGKTLGFAKLALSPLAGALVERETANLRALAAHRFEQLQLPRVIRDGRWNGHEFLVLSPLPCPLRRYRRPGELPVAAMRELAEVDGIEWAPLTTGEFWAGLRSAAATPGGDTEHFARLLDRIEAMHGETAVPFGCWHGDWGPWNMTWSRLTVCLWDWERFDRAVPYGLDALRYGLPDLPDGFDGPQKLREHAAALLATLGSAPALSDVVLTAYLAALLARFIPDSRTRHGAPLRPRIDGLLDVLESMLGEHHTPTDTRHVVPGTRGRP